MRAPLGALLLALTLAGPACDSDSGARDADTTTAPDTQPDTTDEDTAPDTTVPDDTSAPDAGPDVEIADGPGLGIDYDATPPGATPRYELGADDWMSVGWPSDRFRDGERVTLTNMPSRVAALLKTYMAFGEDVLNGWGLNGAIYFQLDGVVDPAALPAPETTLAADSPIQLVNVTASSPHYGTRMPLLFSFYEGGGDPFYSPLTLAMRPVYGFPLAEGDTYCAVVTRAVEDAAGHYLQQAPELAAALGSEPSLAPLAAWLPDSQLSRADLAVATCFTAQDATGELARVAAWIDDTVPPELDAIFEPGVFGEFHGTYTAPNFQAGMKPYQSEGDIRFDDAGDPIVQAEEELRFLLLTPPDHVMPPEGWPVTLYAHGTGGDYESCRGDTRELIADGIAVLCIDQPLHGSRGPNGVLLSEVELVLFSFNFVNPYAGRSSFRQAAIDTILLSRMVEAGRFELPAAGTKAGLPLALDPERIYFFGHSHGGLSGTLAMAVDPRIKAGIISGMSGVIVETILRRKDPADLAALAAGLLNIAVDDLDSFHPALNLMQMLVDATDPINYTRYWLAPRRAIPPKHVFVTEGTLDAASPSVGTDAATAAGALPQIRPLAKVSLAHELAGITPVDLPVKDNVALPSGETRTVAMRAWQGGSHFVAFSEPSARALWRHFIWSDAYGDGAELATGAITLTRQVPVSAADTCAAAREIPTEHGFPVLVRGNTRLATPDHTSVDCAGETDPLGEIGRDVFYRFTAPAEGTYRFRIALQPPIDRDTPRFGPDLVAVLGDDCASCLGRRADGSLDLTLDAGESVVVAVDGTTSADVGAYSLIIEERCLVLACGERECGDFGCGNCGACDATSFCNADGRCVPRAEGDTCESAIAITSVPFLWSGDTRGYLHDAAYTTGQCPDFPFSLGGASADVVFAFTPPTSGTYVARLDGDFDTNLWTADDCALGGAACLGAQRTGFRDARVLIDGTAGETVFIFADGASNTGNSAGHATLEVDRCVPDCSGKACGDDGCGGNCGTCPDAQSCVASPGACAIAADCPETRECKEVPGDTCASAFAIEALPYSDTRSTGGFYTDYGLVGWSCEAQADGTTTQSVVGFFARDVAYAFTAPKDGLYRFGLDTGDPVFNASLYLVSDCADTEASCLAADERERNERLWVELDSGETVYAIVDGVNNFTNQSGSYTLEVRECVASCENRECGGDGCLGSCGGCQDGLLCQGGRCRPPPGELCDNPRVIASNGRLPWAETLDTSGYGADRESACEGAGASARSPEVTYRFEAPGDATYRFTIRPGFAALVYLDRGCDEDRCLDGAALVIAADGEGRVDRPMARGERILITIDGADQGDSASAGAFAIDVRVACDPQCDGKECGADGCGGVCGTCSYPRDVCTPEQLCVDPRAVEGNTCDTPFEIGALPFSAEADTSVDAWDESLLDEAQCAGLTAKGMGSADQVWRLTAAEAGDYVIEVTPDGWDAVVYALGDCADPVGTCLGADDGQSGEVLTLTLGAAQIVYIVVDGEDNIHNDAGKYRIDVRRTP